MRTTRPLLAVAILAMVSTSCGLGLGLGSFPPTTDLNRARSKTQRLQGQQLLMEQAQVQKAAQEFERAVELDPHDAQARFWAASTAKLLGQAERRFDHLLAAALSDHPLADVAIGQAYQTFTRRTQAERLLKVLSQVIARVETREHVRARALHYRGHTLRFLGRFAQANRTFKRLGYVSQWMVIGPFDNDQNAGFDNAYPPETEAYDPKAQYPGKLRSVSWRPVNHFAADGRISLRALLDPARWSTAYLVTWVHSSQDQETALRLAAFQGVKLWLNDRLLLADDEAKMAALDQYVVAGKLEKGWNKILIKVCQRTGPWQLGLRLTDLEGAPLTGLRTQGSSEDYPQRASDKTPLPQAQSLTSWLTEQTSSPFIDLIATAHATRMGNYKQAAIRASALARRHPRSPLAHMQLFATQLKAEHEGGALKALAEAEKLSPGLPAALLARANYEQRHKRYERALNTLRPLLQANPLLPAAQVRQIALLRARGWHDDAMKSIGQAISRQPDRAWLHRMKAATHFDQLQTDKGLLALRRAMTLRADHKKGYDDLIGRELLRGNLAQALRLSRQRTNIFPTHISSTIQEARILLAQGKYDQALKVCERIEGIAPDYWYLHKTRADILYRQGKREPALLSYNRSLDCAPDNPKLREYIDFLVHRPDRVFERYGRKQAEVEALLSLRPDPAAFPTAEALFVLDDHVTHVFQDGSAKHFIHQIYLVLNEKGQRRFSKVRVPSSSSFRLEMAETIQPDGTRQEATSIRRGSIHFPSLRPGSVLHLAYRFDSASSSWMEDHFAMSFNFQSNDPVLNSRWVLALPKSKTLKVLTRGSAVQGRQESLDNDQIFIWNAQKVPMLHREAFRPPRRNIRQAVYVSTVPSWADLAHWQNSLIQDQFEIDDQIRSKTEEITRTAKTAMDKVEAIYRFVAKEVRYLNHDVGIFGKKPNKAINVFENRFGDCKDKATLMIAMLRQVGLKAAYAAVRTRDAGQVFWEVPYAQTNHIITYLPKQEGIEKDMFIDGTARYGHVLYLPERDQGVRALVLDGNNHQILTTPELTAQDSGVSHTMQARRAGPDGLAIHVRERWRGWYAAQHRSILHTAGKREEELSKTINYRFPGAQLERAIFDGLSGLGPEAGVEFDIKVPGQVRQEGDTLRLQLLWPSELTSRLARKPERRYDLFNLYPLTKEVSSTFQIPQGHEVASLPRAISLDSQDIHYSASCEKQDGQVLCRRKFQMKTRLIPTERYQAFRAHCLQADQSEKQDLVFRKKTVTE